MSTTIGYVQTPNIGLYKPVYQADLEMWGTHLNANADTLDAMLSPYAGGAFLPIAGGVMAGALTLAADPTSNLQAATKQYVDAHSGTGGGTGYLPLSGGALTGPLTLAADPAAAMQPVTLQYYNAHVPTATASAYLARAGGTMTGILTLAGNATANLSPVTLQQMNAAVGAYLPLAGGHMTGYMQSAAAGASAATQENLPTLDFLGSTINFQRRITNTTTGAPAYGGVRVFLSNQSSNWVMQPWGAQNGPVGFYVQATTTPTSNGSTTAFQSQLNSQGNNPFTSQDVAGSFTITKTGQNSTWAIATQTQDNTGLAPGAFASIGAELDIVANGPDAASSLYDCSTAGRIGVFVGPKVNPTQTYAAATHFNLGNLIVATPSGGVATIYICTTAGTTGATAPTWPTSGTVTDGTVVWTTGTTNAMSLGTAFFAGGAHASGAVTNTVLGSDADIGNAGLDFSKAHLVGTNAAVIRFAANMPIDFTGNTTNAGKNLHTLQYATAGTPRLSYAVGGTERWSVNDSGTVSSQGLAFGTLPANAANDAGASSAGVPVGGVYRNGSVLMVRTA